MLARSPAEDRFEPTAGAGAVHSEAVPDVELRHPVYPSFDRSGYPVARSARSTGTSKKKSTQLSVSPSCSAVRRSITL